MTEVVKVFVVAEDFEGRPMGPALIKMAAAKPGKTVEFGVCHTFEDAQASRAYETVTITPEDVSAAHGGQTLMHQTYVNGEKVFEQRVAVA